MNKLIIRNNTSFLKSVNETIKSIKKDENDALKYHQRLIHEYLLYYPHIRGMLIYWEMGSGKTILSASIIDDYIKNKISRKIFFISSKTLHGNFVSDYKKYLKMVGTMNDDEMNSYIYRNCHFITLTANNMLQQIHNVFDANINLNDCFVVIDEAHNFFNGVTNGSKNYTGLYQMIMDAKNVKLLFLSGSPITNDPFEIAICFNMLNGYFKTQHNKTNIELSLFGDDYDDFNKYFISNPNYLLNEDKDKIEIPQIKNKEKFSNRIVGLVSFYGTDQSDIKKLFPKISELIIQKVPMSTKQYAAYITARDKELEESKKATFGPTKKILQKPSGASSSYRVRSRQISNFLFPEYASKQYKDEKGYDRYEKYIDQLTPETFNISTNNTGLETWSPKIVQLLVNLSMHLPNGMLDYFRKYITTEQWMPNLIKQKQKPGVGPGIIYSQFIDSGIGLIGKILKQHEMNEITDIKDIHKHAGGNFAIISGEVAPELRAELVTVLMSPENKKGEIIALLMITATGAEGISTKYMRHIHALEPFWHWARLRQVFARASRLGSHLDLPIEDQTVQEYIYLSDYPIGIKGNELTTDVNLYYKAIQNQLLIDSFLDSIKEVSIDCLQHYGDVRKCKICAPTNEPLFINDLSKDMLSPSPCKPLEEEKIVAQSIILEDNTGKREYMYYIKDKEIHILTFIESLNAYQEIFEDNQDYNTLIDKIKKHNPN